MNMKIALSARDFYSDHFMDAGLKPEQFTAAMKAAAGAYLFLEDRISFIGEVLRLGRLDFGARRQPVIYHTKEQNAALLDSISLF